MKYKIFHFLIINYIIFFLCIKTLSKQFPFLKFIQVSKYHNSFDFPNHPVNLDNNGCWKRKNAHFELQKVLKPHINDYQNPQHYVLLIGCSNSIGIELQKLLTKKKINYLSIGTINDLDFTSSEALTLFDNFFIYRAFITYYPPLMRHTTSDGSKYLEAIAYKYFNGLLEFLKIKGIKWIFASSQYLFDETINLLLNHNGSVVELPFLVDSNAYDDLENPIMRAVRECRIADYSHIEFSKSQSYQSITSKDVAEFLVQQIDKKNQHITIQGFSKTTIQDAIYTAIQSANLTKCTLYFSNYSHVLKVSEKSSNKKIIGAKKNVIKMISEAYTNFSYLEKTQPYLSIVVTGRHDNYSISFEERAQNFLNALNYTAYLCPLANFEIVFVDYGTDENLTLLADVLKIGNYIKHKIRYIIVKPKIHNQICEYFHKWSPFYEYIAKNIGIKRSQGEMILITNPDNIFSTEFMEIIASRQLNPQIVYTATRWDTNDKTFEKLGIKTEKLISLASEVWTLTNIQIKQRCPLPKKRYVIVDSCSKLFENIILCAPGDFFLLSKNFWEYVQGFDEIPANPGVDVVFNARLMKKYAGYIRMTIYPIFIHQSHPRKNAYRSQFPNMRTALKNYCCYGKNVNTPHHFSTLNFTWGANPVKFPEIHL